MTQGRLAEALEHYRETLALREALFATDGKNYRTRSALASSCWRTGNLLVSMGRAREAIPLLERAEALLAGPVQTFAQREELANIRFTKGLAYGPKGKGFMARARAEFAQLAREAPGREDFRERLLEIERALRGK